MFAIREFACAHPSKQIEIFLDAAFSMRAVSS
jgi:hypothetical protein